MKYIIEEYVLNEYNASSKARKDVSHFVLQNGFKSLGKNDKRSIRHNKLAKAILALKLCVKICGLRSNDILFLQTSELFLKPILKIKSIRHFKIIYLIHDLYSLRFSEKKSIERYRSNINRDINMMSQCDYVIAHNPRMVDKLKEFGCVSHLVSLNIFDYDTSIKTPERKMDSERLKVAFAGNISKSVFLKTIDVKKHNYDIVVYGAPEIEFRHIVYKGCVNPDILPQIIEGHFGLIWEGDYNITEQDNYNKLNNPHKLSMYIVAGLPIIAWKGSAAAKFAEEFQIGIGIDSLDELDQILANFDKMTYEIYTKNCLIIAEQLKRGYYIGEALKRVCK